MLIAQISDTHIVERGRKTLGVAPMEDNLARVIAHINALDPRPDVVLLTGDVTDNGTPEQMANAARLLDELDCPHYVIPGNHDTRAALWSQFGGAACPSRSGEFIAYVIDQFDMRLIALDSTIAGAAGAELCAARLAWLEGRLKEAPERPTLIFLHHPPVKCGVLETDQDGFIGAERFGAMVQRYASVERVICGHIHLPTHTGWHGTIVSTCPGMGMRLGLDLSMTKESEFLLDDPGYLLHHKSDQGVLVSHVIRVDAAKGPYPFTPQG